MKNEVRNWSDIRVFLAVIRAGSTLAASRRLGLAQPTVARRIDVLEDNLGLTLFDRETRGFKPTKDALQLVARAETIERAMSDFFDSARTLTAQRPIRITAYAGNFTPRMNAIIGAFTAQYPDAAFEFLPGVEALDLMAGEADIALRVTVNDPDPALICRKISTAQWSLFGTQSYADKHGLPNSPDDLRGHHFVTFERRDVPLVLHNWLIRHVAPEQIVMSFSEVDLMHAAIASGHGLGLMNLRLAELDDTLLRCFQPIEELSRPHVMLISPDAHRRPEVRAFTKFFAPRYAALFK